jgi:hypothetical protein
MASKKIAGLFCIAAMVLLVSCANHKSIKWDSQPWDFEQNTNPPVWTLNTFTNVAGLFRHSMKLRELNKEESFLGLGS